MIAELYNLCRGCAAYFAKLAKEKKMYENHVYGLPVLSLLAKLQCPLFAVNFKSVVLCTFSALKSVFLRDLCDCIFKKKILVNFF